MNVTASVIKTVHVATERDSTSLLEQLDTRSLSFTLLIPKLSPEEVTFLDVEDPSQLKFSRGKMSLLLSVEMIHLRKKRGLEDRRSVQGHETLVALDLYAFV